jgi:hypothetical protein
VEARQHVLQNQAKQVGRQTPQALFQGLRGNPERRNPQDQFLMDQAGQGGHALNLPPNHGENQGHHDREGQDPLPQAAAMKFMHHGQRGRIDPFGQPGSDFCGRRGCRWTATAVPVNGAGVTD